ncbi:MAG: hypothetical protein LW724_20250, partial [Planctomycetaceae bacterium]|nr:hypothetical protein [Planctomycetaceae bacterium]
MRKTRFFLARSLRPLACAATVHAFLVMGGSSHLLAQTSTTNSPANPATGKTMNQDNPFFEASKL